MINSTNTTRLFHPVDKSLKLMENIKIANGICPNRNLV